MILNHITFIRLGELVHLGNRNKSFTSRLIFFNIRKQTPNDGIGLLHFARQDFPGRCSQMRCLHCIWGKPNVTWICHMSTAHDQVTKDFLNILQCAQSYLLCWVSRNPMKVLKFSAATWQKTVYPRKPGYMASCPLAMDSPRNPPRKESSHKYDSILAK